jgi:hypothetical protein
VIGRESALRSLGAEGYLATWALSTLGCLRFGSSDETDSEGQRLRWISSLLSVQELLVDSYLLVATVVEMTKLSGFAATTQEQRRWLKRANRGLQWLTADGPLLDRARETLSRWDDMLRTSVIVDVQGLSGVSAETYQAADAGDRQAMKKILRNMWTRDATVEAISSPLPWADWMLRMIGAGTPQSIADLFGVIDQMRKRSRLTDIEADALDRLLEQYIGPDEVDETTARTVLDTFAGAEREHRVLELFMTHDQLASHERPVPISEVQRAVTQADELGSLAARTYFAGVWCEKAAQLGAVESAVAELWNVLGQLETLADEDPEFSDRIGVTALLLRQLCQQTNDARGIAIIDASYMDAMQAYLANIEQP